MREMRKAKKLVFFAAAVCLSLLLSGFKLEKSAKELTETQTVKAPTAEEENKVKEGPPSPSFKMDSFDDFMTSGPIKKASPPSSGRKKYKDSY